MSTSCKVRCFYFFALNAAIRMTISSSTAPTSTIPKPLDVSHIQIVAAQTILRFPSILTLLISLPWGDGRLLGTGGGGRTRTHDFNPLPSREGRPDGVRDPAKSTSISIHSPHARGDLMADGSTFCMERISIHSPRARGDRLRT